MSKATRATAALDRAGVIYSVHAYTYDPEADRIGVQAAESLGVSPGLVLKTLMALVDGKPVCVIVPSDKEVSMKRLAAACGGKSAEMMRSHEAERLSGYHVGGVDAYVSPNRAKMVRTTNPPNDVPHVISYEQST